ncbi:MAG: hypothetical protein HW379_1542, partial [Actinobacteria bacterium]|nr:hypothetical protein [Actinomycetota bacterium]
MSEYEEDFLSEFGLPQPQTSWRIRTSKRLVSVLVATLLVPISTFVSIPAASAATATKLAVTTAAAGAASGAAFTTQPVITVQDVSSATVTGVGGTVSVRVDLGGQLVGTTTATINSATGTATFSGLGISGTAGVSYTLTYSVGGLTTATQTITPTFGAAARLWISTYAVPNTTDASLFTTHPVIQVRDAAGNIVTNDTRNITISAGAGATITAGSTGALTKAAVGGVATFTNVRFTQASPGTADITITYTGTLTVTQLIQRAAG